MSKKKIIISVINSFFIRFWGLRKQQKQALELIINTSYVILEVWAAPWSLMLKKMIIIGVNNIGNYYGSNRDIDDDDILHGLRF